MADREFRIEKDTMGEMKVPANCYYGAQTARAVENFPVSGLTFQRAFIEALGIVKLAAVRANRKLDLLDGRRADAIAKAAEDVISGKMDGEFVVDIFQTGSGTSTNMNANEVIANRAIEILGGKRGDKSLIHPNDHVNMSQSTNDVIPTAIHIAALQAIERQLIPAMKLLADALWTKSKEFESVVKAGRTHLQDAVPITLGQEFSGYASIIEHGIRRLESCHSSLSELALGGTALGTGLNAPRNFAETAISEINNISRSKFRRAENSFEAMQNRDAAVETSGVLRCIAVGLMKIANDLRLMSSGPKTALAEIELPATQPGSSIMPGKVNPVIAESVNMVAAQVMGNDTTIMVAGQSGQLDLNITMPVIAYNMIQSIEIEANAARMLAERCIQGIRADATRCRELAERSLALVTAIAPVIGYDNAAKISKKALDENKSVREAILEEGILSRAELEKILDLKRLCFGGRI